MRSEWAFLTGMGAGVVLGIILAPQSGKETQEYIGRKAQRGVDQIGSAGKKVSAQVKDAVSRGKEQVENILESGKAALPST